MSETILGVKDLFKAFGKQSVLNNINLKLLRGEFLLLVGHNGVGKSTLLKTIMGLLPRDKGEIIVNGRKIIFGKSMPTEVAYLPERINLYRNLTVFENLLFFARLQGVSREKIKPALMSVGLEQQDKLLAGNLSKGQLQRLALSVIMLDGKKLMLLDEPLSGLDYQGISDLITILQEIKSRNTGLIVSTHYLLPFEKLADSALLLENGRLIPIEKSNQILL